MSWCVFRHDVDDHHDVAVDAVDALQHTPYLNTGMLVAAQRLVDPMNRMFSGWWRTPGTSIPAPVDSVDLGESVDRVTGHRADDDDDQARVSKCRSSSACDAARCVGPFGRAVGRGSCADPTGRCRRRERAGPVCREASFAAAFGLARQFGGRVRRHGRVGWRETFRHWQMRLRAQGPSGYACRESSHAPIAPALQMWICQFESTVSTM